MTKTQYIEKNTLAVEALDIMNINKITGLCVHNKTNLKNCWIFAYSQYS